MIEAALSALLLTVVTLIGISSGNYANLRQMPPKYYYAIGLNVY